MWDLGLGDNGQGLWGLSECEERKGYRDEAVASWRILHFYLQIKCRVGLEV